MDIARVMNLELKALAKAGAGLIQIDEPYYSGFPEDVCWGVKALNTLITKEGDLPAIEGFADQARPISAAEKAMVAEGARRLNEPQAKKLLGIQRWLNDASFEEALEMLVSKPTVNIEGLVGGYTGPGGKTILPHKAVAKLDLRLVPDMTAAEALEALKKHLAKQGYGDIEVRMTGGYDPTSTSENSTSVPPRCVGKRLKLIAASS